MPTIIGTASDDTLAGTGSNDTVNGLAGDDVITGGGSSNRLNGGDGDTYRAIENVRGSSHDDTLTGNKGNNILEGGDGDDIIDGGLRNDTLSGGAGDDTLTGGNQQDTFIFSADGGDDVVTDFSTTHDTLDLSATTTDFTDTASVQAAATEVDGGLLVDLGGGDSVLLSGLGIDDLAAITFTL